MHRSKIIIITHHNKLCCLAKHEVRLSTLIMSSADFDTSRSNVRACVCFYWDSSLCDLCIDVPDSLHLTLCQVLFVDCCCLHCKKLVETISIRTGCVAPSRGCFSSNAYVSVKLYVRDICADEMGLRFGVKCHFLSPLVLLSLGINLKYFCLRNRKTLYIPSFVESCSCWSRVLNTIFRIKFTTRHSNCFRRT